MCTQINFDQFYQDNPPHVWTDNLILRPLPKIPINTPFSDNCHVKNTLILYYYGIFFILSTIGIYWGCFTFVNKIVYSISLVCVPSTGSSSFSPHRSHSYPNQSPTPPHHKIVPNPHTIHQMSSIHRSIYHQKSSQPLITINCQTIQKSHKTTKNSFEPTKNPNQIPTLNPTFIPNFSPA